MTQYEATCTCCGGKVLHLEQRAVVERCDECKGDKKVGAELRAARFDRWGTK